MSNAELNSQMGNALFSFEFGTLYGASARLNVQHLSAQIANMVHGHSGSKTLFIEPEAVTSL